jgi:hypothetical protein
MLNYVDGVVNSVSSKRIDLSPLPVVFEEGADPPGVAGSVGNLLGGRTKVGSIPTYPIGLRGAGEG